MSGPTSVRDTSMRLEGFGQVGLALINEFPKLSNLSHFLESTNFILLIAIYGETRRVVASVFKARESFDMSEKYTNNLKTRVKRCKGDNSGDANH